MKKLKIKIVNNNKIKKSFKLTTLSLNNVSTIFLIVFVIMIFGTISYISLPKELFPEVNIPQVFVQTVYPGNPSEDIENLITRPLEKELKSIKGIDNLKSTSSQDVSLIFIEFQMGTDIEEALLDVKDAVDKAKKELPNDMLEDPSVTDLDLSETPILNVNISGDYSVEELKNFAEYLKDEAEKISEISKVEIKGVNEKEIQINVDQHKLDANEMSFNDIENAIASENVSMSGGDIKMGNMRRSIRIIGEFKNMSEIEDIIVKHEKGNIVYLRDVAEVVDGYEEPESFARLFEETVVSIQIVKKSGENLLAACDNVFALIEKSKKDGSFPQSLQITTTNDMSDMIRKQLKNLEDSMIMGFLFVVIVLFFFLGLRNALFVGIAIPMSMFLSFSILGFIGATINMMVLFSLILALGMLVDNAIVAVENIYRFTSQGYKVFDAAKYAVGEIAWPIISSTATTLAAFFPLVFWEDIMGEFMRYLPITLIIVLTSSLFVALIIIPVFALTFVKAEDKNIKTKEKKSNKKNFYIIAALLIFAIIFYFNGSTAFGNILSLLAILILLNILILERLTNWFQNDFLTWLENSYLKLLNFALYKKRPYLFLISTFLLLIFTIFLLGVRVPKIVFMPDNEPKYVNIIALFPVGSDITITNERIKKIEKDIFKILEPYKEIIKSVLTTVGKGANRQNEVSLDKNSNKALIAVNFLDYEFRKGISTSEIMKVLSDNLLNKYAGVEFFLEKDAMGPPTGAPLNIEISGKNMDKLFSISDQMKKTIEDANIPGIEKLKIDVVTGKPEIIVNIDRSKARRFGLSTAQIAGTIRTSLFGKEISDYKIDEDEYPIQLRMQEKYRYNLTSLMNQKVTFRNNRGELMQIPISSVAKVKYSSSYGSIKRKDMNRVLTLFSNVVEGYNADEINKSVKHLLKDFKTEKGYEFIFTGEQEEQEKTAAFLMKALLISVFLILIILVSQFNSFVKPAIIIAGVVFSTIGVFGGIATFKMDIVILMTGIGIISLAGVVVNNAIVLIDYIDYLKSNRKKELGIDEKGNLPYNEIVNCISMAGKTRLRPVLLTAITTILGLFPMAVGLNIDFAGLFSNFDANIYMGGDNASFWGPMSWTIIFGLSFATFLTLIIIPVMYLITNKVKIKSVDKIKNMKKRK